MMYLMQLYQFRTKCSVLYYNSFYRETGKSADSCTCKSCDVINIVYNIHVIWLHCPHMADDNCYLWRFKDIKSNMLTL